MNGSNTMRVYLAKSNRANPDLVIMARESLSRFDAEIVEFKGGEYSDRPLLSCELLVVIPDLNIGGTNWVCIGKGLFEQIKTFKQNNDKSNILIVNSYLPHKKSLGMGNFKNLELLDENDYVMYGNIIFNDYDDSELVTFEEMLLKKLNQQ